MIKCKWIATENICQKLYSFERKGKLNYILNFDLSPSSLRVKCNNICKSEDLKSFICSHALAVKVKKLNCWPVTKESMGTNFILTSWRVLYKFLQKNFRALINELHLIQVKGYKPHRGMIPRYCNYFFTCINIYNKQDNIAPCPRWKLISLDFFFFYFLNM